MNLLPDIADQDFLNNLINASTTSSAHNNVAALVSENI